MSTNENTPPIPPPLRQATVETAKEFAAAQQTPIADLVDTAIAYSQCLAQEFTDYIRLKTSEAADGVRNDAHKFLTHELRVRGCATPASTALGIVSVGYSMHVPPLYYLQKSLARELASRSPKVVSWPALVCISRLLETGPAIPDPLPRHRPLYEDKSDYRRRLRPYWADYDRRVQSWRELAKICHAIADEVEREGLSAKKVESLVNVVMGNRPAGRPRKRGIDVTQKIEVPPIPVW